MILLFEIGTEELPAFYVDEGREGLENLLSERLKQARLSFDSIELFSTPRRLAARISGLPEGQERQVTERRGPSVKAGEKAAQGFAGSIGKTLADLTEKDGYYYVTLTDEGKATQDLLPELLANVVRDLPAKRKMRWGAVEDCQFVRPVQWLVALLDDQVLPVQVAGLTASRTTKGHRFMAPTPFDIQSPASYEQQLEEAYVIASQQKRYDAVIEAARGALEEGQSLEWHDDLVSEIVNLVEYPTAYLGRFDEKYLKLPDEVLAETMMVHQRYFPVKGETRLVNGFVVISNNRVPDVSVPMKGYVQVLDGRLSDALFFWNNDIQKTLVEHRERLSGMAFQKGLGNMLDKQTRLRDLSQRLAAKLGADSGVVSQAAEVFKADLATQLVYEYADLAGVVGKAYALNEGKPAEVADALEQGVKPVTAEAELPATLTGAVLSLADRLDTLVGFFSIGKAPSGSADPFGLRRLGIGAVRLVAAFGIEVSLMDLLKEAAAVYAAQNIEVSETSLQQLETFLWERFSGLMTSAGYPVQSVRAAREAASNFYPAAWRIALLKELSQQAEFEDLATLYKRAANLSKDVEASEVQLDLAEHDSERALFAALKELQEASVQLEHAAKAAFPAWDISEGSESKLPLENQIRQVVLIKPILDAFFNDVMVMVENEQVRQNRLAALAQVRQAVQGLARLELL